MRDSVDHGRLPSELQQIALRVSAVGEQLVAGPNPLAEAVVTVVDEMLPNVRWSSITILQSGRFHSLVVSDPHAEALDRLQYSVGSGPCIDAALNDSVYVTGNVCEDTRWPKYGAQACAANLRSVLTYRLHLDSPESAVAALNLYSDQVDAFDEEAIWTGTILASQAALAVSLELTKTRAHELEQALRTNREIATAVGFVVGRHGLSRDQALSVLRLASQHSNRKLADIATEVLTTGDLPLIARPRADRRD